MKIIISIVCFFILILIGCTKSEPPRRQSDILSDEIIMIVSERLNTKYGLVLSAIGGSEDKGGVWFLNAGYKRFGSKVPDIEEARGMILDCTREFLNEANNSEDFKPYMKVYPFTEKNLGLTILNYDENGREFHSPQISCFSMNAGVVYYKSLGPEVRLPFAKTITETYEEALNLSKIKSQEAWDSLNKSSGRD